MDGNRRWTKKSGLSSQEGHSRGGDKLKDTLKWCLQAGIRTVTVYAFSLENFKRPPQEVEDLLRVIDVKFRSFLERTGIFHQHRIRVRVLGDLTRCPGELRSVMARVMQDTEQYAGGPTLNICLAYTARHDMATAIHDLARHCRGGEMRPEQISESAISSSLSTGYAKSGDAGIPHPQLVVGTSGDIRLSDFLLWEASDAVLSFYPALWPELTRWDFASILLDYQAQRGARMRGLLKRGKQDKCCGVESPIVDGIIPASMCEARTTSRNRYSREIQEYGALDTGQSAASS